MQTFYAEIGYKISRYAQMCNNSLYKKRNRKKSNIEEAPIGKLDMNKFAPLADLGEDNDKSEKNLSKNSYSNKINGITLTPHKMTASIANNKTKTTMITRKTGRNTLGTKQTQFKSQRKFYKKPGNNKATISIETTTSSITTKGNCSTPQTNTDIMT
ncbi:Hypothetical_protein [Hexamita inflata]|uniref:Hypothetical_protein n=1 Tax=Hexamita inflata TaxID=28002 RepID=A0AA86RF86_9EUKA|nr:Hypothetical protein HINF_LOCUS61288 [Hexamita inflata]